MPRSLVPISTVLTGRLDLARYRQIMAYPTWEGVVQALIATRSYAKGLEAGLELLRFAEANQERLTPREFESQMMRLYYFLLDMLDRADQWEPYVAAWEAIRAHTSYPLRYNPTARLAQTTMAPFILRREPGTLWVHFLWLTAYRKAVIERKVEAQRQGRRLGNLRHHPQDELSDEELRRRVDWVAHLVRTMWSWTSQRGPDEASAPRSGGPGPPLPRSLSTTRSGGEEALVREWAIVSRE